MNCVYLCVDGWLPVNDAYIDAQMRKLPPEATEEVRSSQRAAIRNSVSPCPSCRPEQYELWRGGHLDSGHTCDSCVERRKKGRGRRAAA